MFHVEQLTQQQKDEKYLAVFKQFVSRLQTYTEQQADELVYSVAPLVAEITAPVSQMEKYITPSYAKKSIHIDAFIGYKGEALAKRVLFVIVRRHIEMLYGHLGLEDPKRPQYDTLLIGELASIPIWKFRHLSMSDILLCLMQDRQLPIPTPLTIASFKNLLSLYQLNK